MVHQDFSSRVKEMRGQAANSRGDGAIAAARGLTWSKIGAKDSDPVLTVPVNRRSDQIREFDAWKSWLRLRLSLDAGFYAADNRKGRSLMPDRQFDRGIRSNSMPRGRERKSRDSDESRDGGGATFSR
jgi:hypothetical protein